MRFETELLRLAETRISSVKYIHGSIFHLALSASDGEAELVCNGCQWLVLNETGEVQLHDECSLSDLALHRIFAGKAMRLLCLTPDILTLDLGHARFHAFMTKDYHFYLHGGVIPGSTAWQAMPSAARDSFMLFRPEQHPIGYEFNDYLDLSSETWGGAYLEAQRGSKRL